MPLSGKNNLSLPSLFTGHESIAFLPSDRRGNCEKHLKYARKRITRKFDTVFDTVKRTQIFENMMTNPYEEELAELGGAVAEFRKKWRAKIGAVATRTITIDPHRGDPRSIYLLSDGEPQLEKFERAYIRIKTRIADFTERHGNGDKRMLWMPTMVRHCQSVRRRAYQATSVREISADQAEAFLRRHEKNTPKGRWRYFVRSVTGFRYKLLVRIDGPLKEWPVTEWVAIGCVVHINAEKNPKKLKRSTPRLTSEAWAAKKGLIFLCATGKSQLYAKAAKADSR